MASSTTRSPLEEIAELRERLRQQSVPSSNNELKTAADNLPAVSVNMKVRRTLKGHQSKVLCSAWSSDKRHLATTAQDGKVIVWDAFASNKDAEMSCRSTWVVACAFGPLSQNCIAIG
jgi:WD40 repeat protein